MTFLYNMFISVGKLLALFVTAIMWMDSSAQTTSLNVLNPTVSGWVGSVAGQNAGYSGGGNGPAFNAATNTLIFGYTTATATQRITAEAFAIQHALDLSNSGVKINGYNYSWWINNSGDQSGTLSGKVEMLRGGTALQSYTYNYNAPTNGFELKTGTQTFATEQSLLAADQIALSFTGKDNRFWAGYYGPQVRAPSLTLNYTTDPCAGNPAYSPSCSGYNTVVTSPNLFTGMTGSQAYAINQALSNAGAGAMIHGFNYGYDYSIAGRQCSFFDMFGFCLTGYNYSDAGVATVITDSNSATIYSESNTHNGGDNGTSGTFSKQFRFGTSRQISTLGGFGMASWTSGNASITNMYSSAVYTVDPCLDPLSSPSCPGYAAAYQTQQCNANPLYNSSCPGYAQAYFTQQCTVNALYDPSCPGYASAYLTYQCSINPLYSTTCAGYAEAYKTQQCTASPLYATDCPGYEQAYLNAQCIRDSLYSTSCEGYATAYAVKYLMPVDSTTSTAINSSLSSTAAIKASDPTNTVVATNTASTTVSTDGTVSTGVSATGDTNVDKAIASKTTSTTNTSPAAAVQLAPPPPAPSQQMAQNEPKGGGDKQEPKNNDKQEGKKDEPSGDKPGGGPAPQTAQGGQQGGDSKPAAPTARQELQAKREAAAKAEAVEKGKNLANEMGKAADMESQKAVQNVVIQAMGFTPGFDVYNRTIVVDSPFYKPVSIYNNQKNIDNRANLRMFGGTDRLHNEMVEKQYEGR